VTDRNKQQAGFSIIETTLFVVAVGMILGAGWFAYQHNRPQPGNATQKTGQPAANQPAMTGPGPIVSYLEVKEWGVKLPLSAPIKDAYYVVSTVSSDSPDGLPSTIWLGRRSLDTATCNPANNNRGKAGALGAVLRFLPAETDAVTSERLTEKYPNGTLIGDYYYGYQGWTKNNPCASDDALENMDAAFAGAAKKAIPKTTATN